MKNNIFLKLFIACTVVVTIYGMDDFNNTEQVRERLHAYIEQNTASSAPVEEVLNIIFFLLSYINNIVTYVKIFDHFEKLLKVPLENYPELKYKDIVLQFPSTIYMGLSKDNIDMLYISLSFALQISDESIVRETLRRETISFFEASGVVLKKGKPILEVGSLGWVKNHPLKKWIEDMYKVDGINKSNCDPLFKRRFPFEGPFFRDWFNATIRALLDSHRAFIGDFFSQNLFVQPTIKTVSVPVVKDFDGNLRRAHFMHIQRDIIESYTLIDVYIALINKLLTVLPESPQEIKKLVKSFYPVPTFEKMCDRTSNLWQDLGRSDRSAVILLGHIKIMPIDQVVKIFEAVAPYFEEDIFPRDVRRIKDFVQGLNTIFTDIDAQEKRRVMMERAEEKRVRAETILRELQSAVIETAPTSVEPESAVGESSTQESLKQDSGSLIKFGSRRKNVLGKAGYDFKVECFMVNGYRDGDPDQLLKQQRLSRHPRVVRWADQNQKKVADIFVEELEYQSITDDFKKALLIIRHDFCREIDGYINTHGKFSIDVEKKRSVLIPGIMRITPLFDPLLSPIVEYGVFEYSYNHKGELFHRFFNIKSPTELSEILEQAAVSLPEGGAVLDSTGPVSQKKGKK